MSKITKSSSNIIALILSIFGSNTLMSLPIRAIELGDEQTFFNKAPRLIRAAATNASGTPLANYQFTIRIPEDAGAPLKAIEISQKPNAERLKFDVSESRAFNGDRSAAGEPLSLVSIGGNNLSEKNQYTLVFEKPVEPGNTVTVSLQAKRNPFRGGVYLFGVTAFPVGENSPGLYLGSARLHFRSSN